MTHASSEQTFLRDSLASSQSTLKVAAVGPPVCSPRSEEGVDVLENTLEELFDKLENDRSYKSYLEQRSLGSDDRADRIHRILHVRMPGSNSFHLATESGSNSDAQLSARSKE